MPSAIAQSLEFEGLRDLLRCILIVNIRVLAAECEVIEPAARRETARAERQSMLNRN